VKFNARFIPCSVHVSSAFQFLLRRVRTTGVTESTASPILGFGWCTPLIDSMYSIVKFGDGGVHGPETSLSNILSRSRTLHRQGRSLLTEASFYRAQTKCGRFHQHNCCTQFQLINYCYLLSKCFSTHLS
jgi:hypothetical protein